ncbi:DUF6668 family protein [Streptomyces sp. NPDC047525]|uniref:DUF6668 family protein n=1 Tax=Streptomyces sp. NPDC047525 TaxID=3155264 RepID=UPI0033C92220
MTTETLGNGNPWIPGRPPTTENATVAPPVAPANRILGSVRPQPGAVPPPAYGGLPISAVPTPPAPGWLWLGVHGGAGVTTLQSAVPGGRDAGRLWPAPYGAITHPVVLVCRSSYGGLMAARAAIVQWASGQVPGIELLGLVVVADAPGKLPRPLRDLMRLVAGGVARTWSVQWMEEWRLGEPPMNHPTRELTAFGRELARLTEKRDHHV